MKYGHRIVYRWQRGHCPGQRHPRALLSGDSTLAVEQSRRHFDHPFAQTLLWRLLHGQKKICVDRVAIRVDGQYWYVECRGREVGSCDGIAQWAGMSCIADVDMLSRLRNSLKVSC